MLHLLRVSTAIVIGVSAALAFDWTEPYHLKLGASPATVFGLGAIVMMWLTRTRPIASRRVAPNPLREVLLGSLTGLVWTAAMLLSFAVLTRIPSLAEPILDRGRAAVEGVLVELERSRNWRAAAEEAKNALREPHSSGWTRELAERAVKNLTATAAAGAADASDLLNEAISIAEQFGVADEYPRAILASQAQRRAAEQLKQQADDAQAKLDQADGDQQRLSQQLGQQAAQQQQQLKVIQSEAAANLVAAIAQSTSERLTVIGGLSRAVCDGNVLAARNCLEKEIGAAKQKRVSVTAAEGILRQLDDWIAGGRPRPLPLGTTARIARVDSSAMQGLLLVDLRVVNADNRPHLGLAYRDLTVRQGTKVLRCGIAPHARTGQLSLAVALDHSKSMFGAPIQSLELAAIDFFQRLPPGTCIRVTSFNDKITLLADWSQDSTSAIQACRNLRAEGGTAQLAATQEALNALSSRPGERALVVFGDGENSLPGPSKEALIAAARQQRIAIYFVALKAGYGDTSVIEAIAAQTHGQSFLAAHSGELAAKFRALADQLTESCYRVAIFGYDARLPIELTIGGDNSIRLSVQAKIESESVAQRNSH